MHCRASLACRHPVSLQLASARARRSMDPLIDTASEVTVLIAVRSLIDHQNWKHGTLSAPNFMHCAVRRPPMQPLCNLRGLMLVVLLAKDPVSRVGLIIYWCRSRRSKVGEMTFLRHVRTRGTMARLMQRQAWHTWQTKPPGNHM